MAYATFIFASVGLKLMRMCAFAKKASKQHRDPQGHIPASLAFHRITTSMIDSYGDIRERELRTENGWETAMQPYAVGSIGHTGKLPELKDLEQLRDRLSSENISQSAIRELMSLLHLSPERSHFAFGRWQENLRKVGKEEAKALGEILETLQKLIPEPHDTLPILNQQGRTPLGDALAWLAVARDAEGAKHEQ